MENKTGRYFKYAIGEIVLVVIGILIALQINSWHTAMQNDKLRTTYTLNLINDLTKDTIQLNARIKQNEDEFLNRLDSVRAVLSDPVTTVHDIKRMGEYIGLSGLRVINTYNNNTLNILVSTGHIDLFDEVLIQDIMELNRLQNVESSVSEGNRGSYFSMHNNYYERYVGPGANKSIGHELWENVDALEHATIYINVMRSQRHTINRYIELTKDVVAKTEELLQVLHAREHTE